MKHGLGHRPNAASSLEPLSFCHILPKRQPAQRANPKPSSESRFGAPISVRRFGSKPN